MTLREKVAWAICAADCRGDPHVCDMDDHGSHCKPEVCSLWRNYRNGADAALAVIRAVFANPTPEMVRASVQGWLDSGLMSGAIREAARVVLGDDNSTGDDDGR